MRENGEESSAGPENSEGTGNSDAEVTYEQCGHTYISVPADLPTAAEEEVLTAIEEGSYETSNRLILPQAFDLEDLYLIQRDSRDKTYYTAETEEGGAINRLRVTETFPETGPVMLRNDTERDLTFDVRIEYAATVDHEVDIETDGEVFFEETVSVEAGQSTELIGDATYRYGNYLAAINIAELQLKETVSWVMWEEWDSQGVIRLTTEEELDHVSRAHSEIGLAPDCEWNENGDLVRGISSN
ncbi:hypothetical protein [Natrinema amylolyticum]|uniref:hypothetical protein n=1 Tax=Natrinema amylolyticum TaxID=2878679 RepID=UPI001CFACA18|nr:hypothetical protein [Natrinema amylolyticum]